eukprot:UN2745
MMMGCCKRFPERTSCVGRQVCNRHAIRANTPGSARTTLGLICTCCLALFSWHSYICRQFPCGDMHGGNMISARGLRRVQVHRLAL